MVRMACGSAIPIAEPDSKASSLSQETGYSTFSSLIPIHKWRAPSILSNGRRRLTTFFSPSRSRSRARLAAGFGITSGPRLIWRARTAVTGDK